MTLVVDELKKKRAETDLRISEMQAQISVLEQQATFDESRMMSTRISQLSSKASAARGFVLRTLREAGRPITTADFA